tara:strand:- start:288 stop:509 length:222 start_codon:yes stop_codon:yes gene_type:complete
MTRMEALCWRLALCARALRVAGLLPEFAIGAPFPADAYDARRLAALDVAAQTLGCRPIYLSTVGTSSMRHTAT